MVGGGGGHCDGGDDDDVGFVKEEYEQTSGRGQVCQFEMRVVCMRMKIVYQCCFDNKWS